MPDSIRQQQIKQLIQTRQNAITLRDRQNARRPLAARYNEDGTITRSGGTPERVRGRLANTSQSAGQRVPLVDGRVLGRSRAGTEAVETAISRIDDILVNLADSIPLRINQGDPNSASPAILPEYVEDLVYDAVNGILYVWDTDEDGDPPDPRWVPLFHAGVRNGAAAPIPSEANLTGEYDGQIYLSIDTGSSWRWDADLSSDPPAPSWVPIQQLWQGFTGTPSVSVYIDGAIAINNANQIYTGTTAGGWAEFSGGGGGGGFEGVALYKSSHNQTIPFNTFTLLDWTGWTEVVDTGNYWNPAAPTRFTLPQGLFRVRFNARVSEHHLNTRIFLTFWSIDGVLRTSSGGNAGVNIFGTTSLSSPGAFNNGPGLSENISMDLALPLNAEFFNPTAGNYLEFFVRQVANSGDGGTIVNRDLDYGRVNSVSISVQKLA